MHDRNDLDTLCINTIRTLSMDAVQAILKGDRNRPIQCVFCVYSVRAVCTIRTPE